MIIFENRQDAGRQLAKELSSYKNHPDALVMGLPRGGIEVASEIAISLELPLDIICAAKIRAPFNSELAIGALTDDEIFLDQEYINLHRIPKKYLDQEILLGKGAVQKCLGEYRTLCPPCNVQSKIILLVDDGLARGYTMQVAVNSLIKQKAKKIIPVIPVASTQAIAMLEPKVDSIIALNKPADLYAIGQYYKDFTQTSEEKVVALLFKNRQK